MRSVSFKMIKNSASDILLYSESGKQVNFLDMINVFPEARVFAFEGKMGAGKTTLIKQLCDELQIDDIVNSPTFAIVNVYKSASGDSVYHFDCYRLKDVEEALSFGADEYLYSNSYCFVEWPEVISSLLPSDTVVIEIQETEVDTIRRITISKS